MIAYITVGVSASGKSTWAAERVRKDGFHEINRDWIRFNLVSPGSNWSNYKFNGSNEKQVSEIQGQMIMEMWAAEANIIISDTNLNKKVRNGLINKLTDLGYEVRIMEFPVSYETALKRDRLRINGVGDGVIYRQTMAWNEYKGRITYVPDESLPKAIIVDVDGTIAEMNGRGPFDWHRVGEDKPRDFIIDMVVNYKRQGYTPIIVSGRSDDCYSETVEWLGKHLVPYEEIHMRKQGDYRKDNAVKEEIFWTYLAHKYNIVACIDDRPQMIRLWYDLKIKNVIAVANPYLEF